MDFPSYQVKRNSFLVFSVLSICLLRIFLSSYLVYGNPKADRLVGTIDYIFKKQNNTKKVKIKREKFNILYKRGGNREDITLGENVEATAKKLESATMKEKEFNPSITATFSSTDNTKRYWSIFNVNKKKAVHNNEDKGKNTDNGSNFGSKTGIEENVKSGSGNSNDVNNSVESKVSFEESKDLNSKSFAAYVNTQTNKDENQFENNLLSVNSVDENISKVGKFKGIKFQPIRRFFQKKRMKSFDSTSKLARQNEKDLLKNTLQSQSSSFEAEKGEQNVAGGTIQNLLKNLNDDVREEKSNQIANLNQKQNENFNGDLVTNIDKDSIKRGTSSQETHENLKKAKEDILHSSTTSLVETNLNSIKKGKDQDSGGPWDGNNAENDVLLTDNTNFTTREIEIQEVLNLAATIHEKVNSAAIANANNVVLVSRLLCSPLLTTSRRSSKKRKIERSKGKTKHLPLKYNELKVTLRPQQPWAVPLSVFTSIGFTLLLGATLAYMAVVPRNASPSVYNHRFKLNSLLLLSSLIGPGIILSIVYTTVCLTSSDIEPNVNALSRVILLQPLLRLPSFPYFSSLSPSLRGDENRKNSSSSIDSSLNHKNASQPIHLDKKSIESANMMKKRITKVRRKKAKILKSARFSMISKRLQELMVLGSSLSITNSATVKTASSGASPITFSISSALSECSAYLTFLASPSLRHYFNPSFITPKVLLSYFFYGMWLGYPIALFLEFLGTTIVKLGVFQVLESEIFTHPLTKHVPGILLPWCWRTPEYYTLDRSNDSSDDDGLPPMTTSLTNFYEELHASFQNPEEKSFKIDVDSHGGRNQFSSAYVPRRSTLLIGDLLSYCIIGPIVEETVKLIIARWNYKKFLKKMKKYKILTLQLLTAERENLRTENEVLNENDKLSTKGERGRIKKGSNTPKEIKKSEYQQWLEYVDAVERAEEETLAIPTIQYTISRMVAVSLGMKAADNARRILLYTKPHHHNAFLFAIARGFFPVQELCASLTAIALSTRDVLGSRQVPLWRVLCLPILFHSMANIRGMKPFWKWPSSKPWIEMQLQVWTALDSTTPVQLFSLLASFMWFSLLIRILAYIMRSTYYLNKRINFINSNK